MAVAAVVACGPSSAEIKTAKTASYVGDPVDIFKAIIEATGQNYKVASAQKTSESEFELITAAQWYNPEGGRESAGAGDYVNVVDRSIQLSMIVQLAPLDEKHYIVTVTPKTFQHVSGSPKPRELSPEDPNLPGWVSGRVDSLQLDIHKRLQNYATL